MNNLILDNIAERGDFSRYGDPQEILHPIVVAKTLKVDVDHVHKLAENGSLPSMDIAGEIRFLRGHVESFINLVSVQTIRERA